MNAPESPRPPGHMTRKDTVSCAVVLASIVVTMACGAFVIGAGQESTAQYAQASTGEATHD